MFGTYLACIAGAFQIAASSPAAIDWNDPRSVVEAAITASASLREVEASLAAARARQRSAGVMPNPMVMAGVQNQQVDLSRDPMMTMYMVGASQTFVRKARRESLQRSASVDVQRLEREADVRRAEITRDVLVAYNEAAAAQNQIAANEEMASLPNLTAEAARARQ